MLIAIAGSQGSGKTTIINELKSRGYAVVARKTARSILNDWGVTLDAVNVDFELKQAFQDELVTRKIDDEVYGLLSDEIVFTERTYSDLFTYALISFGQYNKYDSWLEGYYERCKYNCKFYGHVFYINRQIDNVEHDGVRSTNRYYSKMVDREMLQNTIEMLPDSNLSIIDEVKLIERVNTIEDIITITKEK